MSCSRGGGWAWGRFRRWRQYLSRYDNREGDGYCELVNMPFHLFFFSPFGHYKDTNIVHSLAIGSIHILSPSLLPTYPPPSKSPTQINALWWWGWWYGGCTVLQWGGEETSNLKTSPGRDPYHGIFLSLRGKLPREADYYFLFGELSNVEIHVAFTRTLFVAYVVFTYSLHMLSRCICCRVAYAAYYSYLTSLHIYPHLLYCIHYMCSR